MSNIVDEVNQELAKNMKEFLPRLLRLIRTVQQIQEFYERRKDNKLKDNFEELQKSTFKIMKEYEALYNKIYQEKDYQALLPTSFEKIQISKDMEVITQNDDFKQLCEHYYNENYDDDFERAYMKEDNFNYNDFCDETDFEEDIKESIFKEVEQQQHEKSTPPAWDDFER